jgi:hypothetical protein
MVVPRIGFSVAKMEWAKAIQFYVSNGASSGLL